MGRAVPGRRTVRRIGIPAELHERLHQVKRLEGTPISEMLRDALERYLPRRSTTSGNPEPAGVGRRLPPMEFEDLECEGPT
ncbi:MAG: hypothetical protein ACT4PT_01065 [Methanobacteriota archaeon]